MVKSLNLKSSSSRMGPHSRTSLQVELVGDNDGGQVGDNGSEQQHISQLEFPTTLWELFLHLLQSRSPPRPVFDRQCCPFPPYLSHSLVFISDQVSMWKNRLGDYIFSIVQYFIFFHINIVSYDSKSAHGLWDIATKKSFWTLTLSQFSLFPANRKGSKIDAGR